MPAKRQDTLSRVLFAAELLRMPLVENNCPKYWLYSLRMNCPNLYIRYLPSLVSCPKPSDQYFDTSSKGSFGYNFISVQSPCLWTTYSSFRVEMSWFGHKYTDGIEHNKNNDNRFETEFCIFFSNMFYTQVFFKIISNFVKTLYFSIITIFFWNSLTFIELMFHLRTDLSFSEILIKLSIHLFN